MFIGMAVSFGQATWWWW